MKISCIILLLSLVALSEGCQCPETKVEVEGKETICIGGSDRQCAIVCVKVVFKLSDADVTWFPKSCLTRRILTNAKNAAASLGTQLRGIKIKRWFCFAYRMTVQKIPSIFGTTYTECLKNLEDAAISIENLEDADISTEKIPLM